MLADELDYVLGVDTHRDQHALAVVTAPAGALLAGSEIGASGDGYEAALQFADRYASGRRVWAIEGSGSYGAGLARFLAGRGEIVVELSRTPRAERRLRGKDEVKPVQPKFFDRCLGNQQVTKVNRVKRAAE